MKKVFSVLLVTTLIASLSISALAANQTVGANGSEEIDVTAKYESSVDTPVVYSVDISWSSMTFTYAQESTKNWNASDHSYETITQGAWENNSATITVTNHSNTAVDVAVTYTAVENTGVTGTLTNGSGTLAAGTEGDYAGADALIATFTVSGTPNSTVTAAGVKVGTLKVTID